MDASGLAVTVRLLDSEEEPVKGSLVVADEKKDNNEPTIMSPGPTASTDGTVGNPSDAVCRSSSSASRSEEGVPVPSMSSSPAPAAIRVGISPSSPPTVHIQHQQRRQQHHQQGDPFAAEREALRLALPAGFDLADMLLLREEDVGAEPQRQQSSDGQEEAANDEVGQEPEVAATATCGTVVKGPGEGERSDSSPAAGEHDSEDDDEFFAPLKDHSGPVYDVDCDGAAVQRMQPTGAAGNNSASSLGSVSSALFEKVAQHFATDGDAYGKKGPENVDAAAAASQEARSAHSSRSNLTGGHRRTSSSAARLDRLNLGPARRRSSLMMARRRSSAARRSSAMLRSSHLDPPTSASSVSSWLVSDDGEHEAPRVVNRTAAARRRRSSSLLGAAPSSVDMAMSDQSSVTAVAARRRRSSLVSRLSTGDYDSRLSTGDYYHDYHLTTAPATSFEEGEVHPSSNDGGGSSDLTDPPPPPLRRTNSADFTDSIVSLKLELAELHTEMDDMERVYVESIRESNAREESLLEMVQVLTSERDDALGKATALGDANERLGKALVSQRKTTRKATIERTQMSCEVERLREERDRHKRRADAVLDERDRFKNERDRLGEMCRELRAQRERLEREGARLKNLVEGMMTSVVDGDGECGDSGCGSPNTNTRRQESHSARHIDESAGNGRPAPPPRRKSFGDSPSYYRSGDGDANDEFWAVKRKSSVRYEDLGEIMQLMEEEEAREKEEAMATERGRGSRVFSQISRFHQGILNRRRSDDAQDCGGFHHSNERSTARRPSHADSVVSGIGRKRASLFHGSIASDDLCAEHPEQRGGDASNGSLVSPVPGRILGRKRASLFNGSLAQDDIWEQQQPTDRGDNNNASKNSGSVVVGGRSKMPRPPALSAEGDSSSFGTIPNGIGQGGPPPLVDSRNSSLHMSDLAFVREEEQQQHDDEEDGGGNGNGGGDVIEVGNAGIDSGRSNVDGSMNQAAPRSSSLGKIGRSGEENAAARRARNVRRNDGGRRLEKGEANSDHHGGCGAPNDVDQVSGSKERARTEKGPEAETSDAVVVENPDEQSVPDDDKTCGSRRERDGKSDEADRAKSARGARTIEGHTSVEAEEEEGGAAGELLEDFRRLHDSFDQLKHAEALMEAVNACIVNDRDTGPDPSANEDEEEKEKTNKENNSNGEGRNNPFLAGLLAPSGNRSPGRASPKQTCRAGSPPSAAARMPFERRLPRLFSGLVHCNDGRDSA